MAIQSTGQRSAELVSTAVNHIPAEANIRLLRDQIIIEPLKVEQSATLEVVEHLKPMRGTVKAVGPGHYPKRYNHPDKHRRSVMWDSKQFQPTELKVGDVVQLGGYNWRGYTFQQFLWGDKVHLVAREADVCIVETRNDDEKIHPTKFPEQLEKPTRNNLYFV